MKSDLYRILRECAGGNLDPSNIIFEREKFAVSVVAASKGYPGLVEKGIKINFSAEEKVFIICTFILCSLYDVAPLSELLVPLLSNINKYLCLWS